MAEREEKKEFVVKDRRIFSQDGGGSTESDAEKIKDIPKDEKKEADKPLRDQEPQLPEINFATFIFSLNSSALLQMGLLENPMTGKKEKNMPLAKQTIDILGMLEDKARGNLTKEEENMLKDVLYNLRMIYIKEVG